MKAVHLFLIALLLSPTFLRAEGLSPCAPTNARTSPNVPSAKPTPRERDYPWMSRSKWFHMHADDVAIAAEGEVDLLFLGDSITESWEWQEGHQKVFEQYFAQYRSANFGIGGDQTQNLLWRLKNGTRGQLNPRLVVLMIGVNNFNFSNHSAETVAAGVIAVVEQTQTNYPNAQLVLNAILPYGKAPNTPERERVARTNILLEAYAEQESLKFIDYSSLFVNEKGEIPETLMGDFLHPSPQGLALMAKQLAPTVAKILSQTN